MIKDFFKKFSSKKQPPSPSKKNHREISAALFKEIKEMQIRTNYLVNEVMAGEYETTFKGRGMEFAEVREYQPGDDIRTIDWNVTARTGSPFVKEYTEERELTVMIMVDLSSSGQFGSAGKMKIEVAAEVASIFAFSAIKNNDRVGLIVFTDKIEQYIPPKKGKAHIWMVIRTILSFAHEETDERRQTDINAPLEFLLKVHKKKSVCFLISDFQSPGFEKTLRMAKQKHDLIAVTITDPRETELTPVGFVEIEDAETGERIFFDTSSGALEKKFKELSDRDFADLKKLFNSTGVDLINIKTDASYVTPIMKFFKMREKRMI